MFSRRRTYRNLSAALIAASMALMLVSVLVPWGKLSAHATFAGVKVDIDADVYVHKVDYEASGRGKVLSTNREVNITLADEKMYATGLGDFQETIGFIKGSSKDYFFTANYYSTSTNEEVNLEIWTHADLIPWWPVGVPQKCKARVVVTSMTQGIESVTVKGTRIEMLPGDGTPSEFTPIKLGSKGGDRALTKVGDGSIDDYTITLSKDYGYVRIYALADITVKAKDGSTNFKAQEGYSSISGPGGIALWTINQERTARIGMMVGAFPMILAGVGIGGLTIAFLFARPSSARRTGLVAAVILGLAVPFYMTGVTALIELTGYYSWFKWSPGLAIPWVGFGLMVGAITVLFMIPKRKKDRVVDKAKGKDEAKGKGKKKGITTQVTKKDKAALGKIKVNIGTKTNKKGGK